MPKYLDVLLSDISRKIKKIPQRRSKAEKAEIAGINSAFQKQSTFETRGSALKNYPALPGRSLWRRPVAP
jgi:hypothetical protein